MSDADRRGPSDAVVSARSLLFTYAGPERDRFRLDVPRLSVARGRHTAIVGPSGCGKTTLLRLLTGVLTPDAGEVTLVGARIDRMGDAARRSLRLGRVGMVFQHFALLEYLTAMENILLPVRLLGLPGAAARDRAQALAERAGVAHTLRRKPRRLSQGERQRVAICRALVTRPPVVVCDEPTGNLDPARAADVVDLIFEQAQEVGATVLVVTHDHGLLPRFDQVVDLAPPVRADTPADANEAGPRSLVGAAL